jgi:hypothetical protein
MMPDLSQPHLCFTKDHPREKAIGTFYDRFGAMPEHVVEDRGLLWLGPIPQPQEEGAHGLSH